MSDDPADKLLVALQKGHSAVAPTEVLVHIPGVTFAPEGELRHEGFEVRAVPYEQWEKFDSALAAKWRRQFEAARPVFLAGTADVALDDAAMERLRELALDVHAALTLASGAPLPSPEMSIAYMRREKESRALMGPMERESIVQRPKALHADMGLLALAVPLLQMVARNREARRSGVLSQAVNNLAASSLPDFEAVDGIVHSVIALEALLLADVTSSVTNAFVTRGAALLADEDEEVPSLRFELKDAYRLRSDALHGRDFAASVLATGRSEAEWYLWLRRALARAAARTMWAIDSAGDPDPALAHLRRDLDAAGNAGSVLARLSKAPGPPLP